MNYTKTIKPIVITCMLGCSTLLISCSGAGSILSNNNSNNGDASVLQIITPKIIYSKTGTVGNGYITIVNPSNTAVKNLHYTLNNQVGGGNSANLDALSAAQCTVVAANSQCNIKLEVAAGAVAGSLGFSASNASLLNKITTQATTISGSLPIGIEQAHYNNVSGADGITLSYYHTVIAGVPYILVSGIVASNKAGSFNNIVLVDGNGNPLPNQQLTSGRIASSQGSTFNILLPVSASSGISQTIKVQTQQIAGDGTVTPVSTSTASSTLVTTTGVGITDMLPGAIYLTAANPEQIMTFANSGDATAQLQSFVASNPNIEVVFSPTTLGSGATTTATLRLKNTTLPATSGTTVLTYNNGTENTSTAAITEQNVTPQPSPTPTPTPAPSPGPSPTPTPTPTPAAGLTTAFAPDNNFFTTTEVGTVSRQLTITNSGNTDEDNFVFNLPTNFAISAGSSNSCSGVTATTISNTLGASGGNCNLTVTYANTAAIAQTAGNITINYHYNSGAVAPSVNAGVNYQVTQSTANLALTPSTAQTYSTITSNNSDVSSTIAYTLTNSGDTSATNLEFNFTGADNSLFHVITGGTCVSGGSLSYLGGSNTCTINTQFGTAPNYSAGTKSAAFAVGYTPYSGGTSSTTNSVALSGTVTAAPSATFSDAITANTFTGGSGSLANPYTGNTNTNYTLSVTYTNTSAIAATGFTTSTPTLPNGWTLSTHNCNNASMSASGGNCVDTYTLNSATSGSNDINLTNVKASWSDSSGSSTNQTIAGVGTVYAALSAPSGANITLDTITPSGFVNNTTTSVGTSDVPFVLNYNANTGHTTTSTITLTYKNTGSDATGFTTTIASLPLGWTLTSHGCNSATLSANSAESCSDIYTFSSDAPLSALTSTSTTVHPTNFNTGAISSSWSDSAGSHTNQTLTADTSIGYNTNGVINTAYFLNIFVSNTTHNGNFATDSTNISTGFVSGEPITNADALCANDANKPNDGYSYKAMLSYGSDAQAAQVGVNRFACGGTPTSAPCVGATAAYDWVLLPGFVQYRSSYNTANVVGTTVSADYGVFSSGSTGILNNFGVSNSINTWTGLSDDAPYQWMSTSTRAISNSCLGWSTTDTSTSTTRGRYANPGNNLLTYNRIYSNGDGYCNASYALYCVQQIIPKRIFVTNTTTDGNIVSTSGKTAAAAADAICNTDSARPNSGAYKALLVTPTRYNNGSGTNSDWPLTASTSYYNMSGTLAFTTNTYGIPPDSLTAAIYPSSALQAWTGAGIPDDNTINWNYTSAENYCNNWTDAGSGMEKAMIGATGATNANVWNYNGGDTCTASSRLYCVQQ